MKRTLFLLALVLAVCSLTAAPKTLNLKSPDGTVSVDVTVGNGVTYNVSIDGNVLLTNCALGMTTSNGTLGSGTTLRSSKRGTIDEIRTRVVPMKNAQVRNHCNTLLLNLSGGFSVEFRAYDNGVAYRIGTSSKKDLNIVHEDFSIAFPTEYQAIVSPVNSFRSSCEEPYKHMATTGDIPERRMTYLPVLVETDKQYKMLISESDLRDYPGMFLTKNGNGFRSVFPPLPLAVEDDGDRSQKFTKEADYIASTQGRRTYPWRYFVISREDKDIVANEMTFLLSSPCEIAETQWIKPGQVSWDWWNHLNIFGVDFKAGINTATYKYFIDFASQYGVSYIIMDEGWAKSTRNPFETIKEIDLPELIRYGRQKGVGVILWLPWLTVEKNMDLFAKYEEWGVAGTKIDFMDRQDQAMVNFYERVVKESAKHHLLVDFHGAYKPSGLEVRYPNLLSYEGVLGLEMNGGCLPSNSIYLPFIRNAVGPMDFTPGSMFSAQPEHNRCTWANVMGNGTRAYQMALYVVFESGIQMLADSPTLYMREPDCTGFITSVPVTWDETRVIDAKVGEYVAVAKRKGNKWFVGAITNDKERTIQLPMNFLPDAADRSLVSYEDGPNCDRQAIDCIKRQRTVNSSTTLTVTLHRNGGWCGVME